jgi:hypothetical protein
MLAFVKLFLILRGFSGYCAVRTAECKAFSIITRSDTSIQKVFWPIAVIAAIAPEE